MYSICIMHMRSQLPAKKKEYRIKEALLKHNVETVGEEDLEDPEELEDSDESDRKSLSSREIREIQKQDFAWMKKSPLQEGVIDSEGAGSEAQDPHPFRRTGLELPGHHSQPQRDPRERARTRRPDPSPMQEARKCPTGRTTGGRRQPSNAKED